jgi:hypothetical protein
MYPSAVLHLMISRGDLTRGDLRLSESLGQLPKLLYFIGSFVMGLCQSVFDDRGRSNDMGSVFVFQSWTKYFVN